jgi:hypothetical protein
MQPMRGDRVVLILQRVLKLFAPQPAQRVPVFS